MACGLEGSNRRDFIKVGALSAGGLALGLRWSPEARPAAAEFRPNAWIRIAPDGGVTLTVGKSEMGQGVRTALPMILADELEVELDEVALVQARPGDDFPDLSTFGSRSVRSLWMPLRRAGAAGREMLIAAAAARWSVAAAACRAEKGRVLHAPTGRSLAYGDLVEAAAKLPVPGDPPLKDPSQFRIVGRSRKRIDGPRIVAGSAIFGCDVRRPGMKFASVIRCPVSGGKPRFWDAGAANAVPGVRLVVPISAGLAVIADDTWAAFSGREALEKTIAWDEGANAGVSSADMLARLQQAADRGGGRALSRGGGVAWAMRKAARRIEAEYFYPFQAHAAMEPMNAVADVRPDRCEVWAGTQSPNAAREEAAKLLGLPLSAVTVNVTLLGGGFGRRGQSDFVREAVQASKAAGAPVQVVWTRQDDMRHGYYHPVSLHRMAAGLDANGRPVAWRHRVVGPASGRSGDGPESGDQLRKNLRGAYDVAYAIPAVSAELIDVPSPVRIGFWRGVQHNQNVFAAECFVDELAGAAGQDPFRYRLGLLRPGGEFPGDRDGTAVDRARLAPTLSLAAEKSQWGGPLPPGGGRGVACSVHDAGTYAAAVAEVSVSAAGKWKVDRVVCAVDCGIAVNPLGVRAQVESGVVWAISAVSSEITLSRGSVRQSSYRDFPVLQMGATPAIETYVLPSEAPPTGMGEAVNPVSLAAVVNALSAATGRRLHRLPVRPRDLKQV